MKKRSFLLIMCVIFFSGCAQTRDEDPQELARTMANELVGKKWMPPGMSIAILQKGKIVFAEGFGFADLENKIPVTTKTQFRAASVSKLMTATALIKLAQENHLDLDAPINGYVPEYGPKKYSITARELSGHLSGIPHYSASDRIEKRFYNSVMESLQVFSHIELLYEPGTEYLYSTHGYTLLSAVIEKISGQSFLDYTQKEIFKPLDMYYTGPADMRIKRSPNMTELYNLNREQMPQKIENPEDPSYKWGGGGMISTPTDLVKLGNAYLNGFIHSNILDDVFKSQKLNSGEETGVGIGWRRNWDMQGRPVFEHAGAMGGSRSILSIFPEHELVIAIMANTYSPRNIEETAHMVALPFLSEATPQKQPKGEWDITLTTIDSNGQEIRETGLLVLDGSADRIVLGSGESDGITFPLTYMNRENIYALAHPSGLLYTKLHMEKALPTGYCFRYRSPRNQPPAEDEPFILFRGVSSQKK